jgi:hypothetical protein
MKRKIGTVIDEEIMRKAKRKAAEKGIALSDVIQEALEAYLSGSAENPQQRMDAFQRFCDHPMKLNPAQLKAVLEADAWE